MADFTINVSKEVGRATLIGTTKDAIAWMAINGVIAYMLDNYRAVSHVDESQVEAMREVLSCEGFSVDVRIT